MEDNSEWKVIKNGDEIAYFFNTRTGVTTTERPPELGGKSQQPSAPTKSPEATENGNDQVANLMRTINETHQSLVASSVAAQKQSLKNLIPSGGANGNAEQASLNESEAL